MKRIVPMFLAIVVLSGCAITRKVVGEVDGYNEYFSGDVVLDMNGSAIMKLTSQPSGHVCSGSAQMTRRGVISFSCAGQGGVIHLNCTDGRKIDGSYNVETCTSGYGNGRDQYGNSFPFVFGLNDKEVEAWINNIQTRISSRPSLPAYNPVDFTSTKILPSTGAPINFDYDARQKQARLDEAFNLEKRAAIDEINRMTMEWQKNDPDFPTKSKHIVEVINGWAKDGTPFSPRQWPAVVRQMYADLSANLQKSQRQPIPQNPIQNAKVYLVSTGTGIIFSQSGQVFTAYHVVQGAKNIKVKFVNGETIQATLSYKDELNDIAMLTLARQPAIQLKRIALGDVAVSRMGEKVFTVGYPVSHILGKEPKYSEGVINSLTGMEDDARRFQISVPIQAGNSGGPLFNEKGEVIGLIASTFSTNEASLLTEGAVPQNVNFAVKSSLFAGKVLEQTKGVSQSSIVPVPAPFSVADFVAGVKNNIVLIEAGE